MNIKASFLLALSVPHIEITKGHQTFEECLQYEKQRLKTREEKNKNGTQGIQNTGGQAVF